MEAFVNARGFRKYTHWYSSCVPPVCFCFKAERNKAHVARGPQHLCAFIGQECGGCPVEMSFEFYCILNSLFLLLRVVFLRVIALISPLYCVMKTIDWINGNIFNLQFPSSHIWVAENLINAFKWLIGFQNWQLHVIDISALRVIGT